MSPLPTAAESENSGGSGWAPRDLVKLFINPIYAIEIDPEMAVPHSPLISEEDWIAANLRTISEVGPEAFLHTLDVLKGRWIAGKDSESDDDEASLHAEVDAGAVDEYVVSEILNRLATEVNLLGRSAEKLRRQISAGAVEVEAEICQLESNANILLGGCRTSGSSLP